ncbi:MAG: ComEC/Rec2 family competence protein [Planktomarina sp.]
MVSDIWQRSLVHARAHFVANFVAQGPQLYLWATVCFVAGAGFFFRLPHAPTFWSLVMILGLGAALVWQTWPRPWALIGFLALGYAWGGVKTHMVAAPVLEKRLYTQLSGKVISRDQSASGKPRITLGHVTIDNMDSTATPARVRIALHGPDPPAIGAHVQLIAHLTPPPGPAEPYGFDFQRHAWFLRLGAVGYTRKDVTILRPPEGAALARVRARLSDWVYAGLGSNTGGVGVAITTGDRSFLQDDIAQDLRRANLAHLLAISGLHMGILAGLVFGILRVGLIALPRGDPKRWAAVGALLVAFAYLLLSGASIATQRAFIMTAVILGAVILRKRAITLRAVALAAWCVLLLRPQAIFSPGFQMSFAATTALVICFAAMTRYNVMTRPGVFRYIFGSVMSAFIAGLATAPFAAVHFNMMPHYGVAANVIAVPLMASVVMPGWIAAITLAPFGLDWMGFAVMDAGLRAIFWVASHVSEWPGSVTHIKAPGPWALPLLSFGLIFIGIWRGRWRGAGGFIVLVAVLLWAQSPRPDVLISSEGALIGVMTPQGRWLSKDKGAGFSARVWLENDGDVISQEGAAERATPLNTWVRPLGKNKAGRPICKGMPAVLQTYERDPGCFVFDLRFLWRNGSVAGFVRDGQIEWTTAKDATGRRIWNDKWVRRDAFAMHSWRQAPSVGP